MSSRGSHNRHYPPIAAHIGAFPRQCQPFRRGGPRPPLGHPRRRTGASTTVTHTHVERDGGREFTGKARRSARRLCRPHLVIPANARIHLRSAGSTSGAKMDSRVRGNDGVVGAWAAPHPPSHPGEGRGPATSTGPRDCGWIPAFAGMTSWLVIASRAASPPSPLRGGVGGGGPSTRASASDHPSPPAGPSPARREGRARQSVSPISLLPLREKGRQADEG
jgi:hypothetical protein